MTTTLAIATTILSILKIIDSILARSEKWLPNCSDQLMQMLITKRPLRAQPAPVPQTTEKGNTTMSVLTDFENEASKFFTALKADLKEIEPVVDKILHLMGIGAGIASTVGKATGNAGVAAGAQIASTIISAADQAVEADITAGATGSTLIAGGESIAKAVASSGAVDTATAAEINKGVETFDAVAEATAHLGGGLTMN